MRLGIFSPRLLLAALVGSVLFAAYVIGTQGPPSLVVPGLGLLAVVLLAALSRLVPAAGAIVSVAAIVLYVGLALTLTPFSELRIVAVVAAAVGYGLTGLTAVLFARGLFGLEGDLERADALIEELTVRDPALGTIKPQFAKQMLVEEVMRARRYKHPFSVVMMGLSEASPPPPETDLVDIFSKVGRALVDRLRTTDKVSLLNDPPRFVLLLAETPLEGAKIIADRLVEETRVGTGINFCSGIATYPNDAVDPDGLLREAESALQFASITDERLAYSDLLRVS